MQIIPFPNGIYGATTYLVYDEKSLDAILIDCTSSINEISKKIKENNLNLKYVLITHGHFDHVYCLNELKEKFQNALVFMNKEDMPLLNQVNTQCTMAEVEQINIPCIDGLLDENTKNLNLGEIPIKIITTKGHSKGGVCYLIENDLFSGDTLFYESIGRCDLFGGSISEIERSIKEKLFALSDEITVYPGHGPKTTIGHEKIYNPYFGSNYKGY
ncbi:MAG: MBL fold metallo-hydrolase [Candidatus Gastranaerophilales bacterium]|nr:MBL fold metallo-hydrolase [Candidatus Gastranaerophilales bacterium]